MRSIRWPAKLNATNDAEGHLEACSLLFKSPTHKGSFYFLSTVVSYWLFFQWAGVRSELTHWGDPFLFFFIFCPSLLTKRVWADHAKALSWLPVENIISLFHIIRPTFYESFSTNFTGNRQCGQEEYLGRAGTKLTRRSFERYRRTQTTWGKWQILSDTFCIKQAIRAKHWQRNWMSNQQSSVKTVHDSADGTHTGPGGLACRRQLVCLTLYWQQIEGLCSC